MESDDKSPSPSQLMTPDFLTVLPDCKQTEMCTFPMPKTIYYTKSSRV